MSTTLMSKSETLDISDIESVFEGVDEVFEGPQIKRTVIGELDGNKLARIRRVSMTVLKREVSHHDYLFDLAAPYAEERFGKGIITLICSSKWVVSPLAAKEKDVVAEVKDSEEFKTFHKPSLATAMSAEDLFAIYDSAKKITPDVTPDISPSIYTPEGLRELLGTANFRSLRTNG